MKSLKKSKHLTIRQKFIQSPENFYQCGAKSADYSYQIRNTEDANTVEQKYEQILWL